MFGKKKLDIYLTQQIKPNLKSITIVGGKKRVHQRTGRIKEGSGRHDYKKKY